MSVIIPTLATGARAARLLRAIETVSSQEGVHAVPIVVVNGADWERSLVDHLHRTERVVTVVIPDASLPEALRVGRAHVGTPWFAELDDDDELLPGALALRVCELEAHPEAGAVVTNGIRRCGGTDELHVADMAAVAADPLRALLRANWLLAGSWLCRTHGTPADLLDRVPAYLECTYLAARLVTETAVRFLQQPTVVFNTDTPSSVSKSRAYVVGQEAALHQILQLDLPPDVRHAYEARLAMACHNAARVLARDGETRSAWRWHLRALAQPGGWKLLPRTLKLVHPGPQG